MPQISPEDFAEHYKEQITNDLREVISNLNGVAAEADPDLQADLYEQIGKLNNARQVLCDVPPNCILEPPNGKTE
jgi:hypothetical protein